jgi:excisionase family DNA binding protein
MRSDISEPPITQIQQSQLVNASKCAAAMSIPKATLYRMIREGLPVYRIGPRGRGLRFSMSEVLTWLRAGGASATSKNTGNEQAVKP